MADSNWGEYSKLVLKKLDDHDDLLKDVIKNQTTMQVGIGQLQIKAGIWGAMGGAIPVAIGLLVYYLKGTALKVAAIPAIKFIAPLLALL